MSLINFVWSQSYSEMEVEKREKEVKRRSALKRDEII